MKTRAVRIYGKNDLRLEEFELPAIREGEVLVRVITNSICMSCHKAAKQGTEHKRIPHDVAQRPTIIGHEFCGQIVQVSRAVQDRFEPGGRVAIQPNPDFEDSMAAVGYSYPYLGGNSTYAIIPRELVDRGCLMPYDGEAYFSASLAEPMACLIAAFRSSYHIKHETRQHDPGVVRGGNMAILGGCGPMGLGAIDYALHCERRPALLVVTDVEANRLARAAEMFPPQEAERLGARLIFVNTSTPEDAPAHLRSLAGGKGYDDVFVMAPVKAVVECGDQILASDGCLNFFAGPADAKFTCEINLFNVHYAMTHLVGTSGGQNQDMREALSMMSRGLLNPAVMVTHVGGLDCVADTTLNLPKIPGGKKLIYTHVRMPLTAIADFAAKGQTHPTCRALAQIVARHNGLWCTEAEACLLDHPENL